MIGGGLIGLSTAMFLKAMRPRLAVTLVEKDDRLAAQQSGHNSGVLHAGIYYEPGSLKADFCVKGQRALLKFCAKHGIPLLRCSKVIVANTDEEIERLNVLHSRGTQNGVPDLRIVDRKELQHIEPHVDGELAIHAPHSAVVDFRQVAVRYAKIFIAAGGKVLLKTEFEAARQAKGRMRAQTAAGAIETRLLINCAGLHADVVARKSGTNPGLRIIPFRGEYYELCGDSRDLVKGLVYPVPNPELPFLDVHLTPTVARTMKAGPNAVLATKREGYRRQDFDFGDLVSTLSYLGFWRLAGRYWKPGMAEINRSLRKSVFLASLRRLVPDIAPDDLVPGGSGVRAQAVDSKGRLVDDFRIEEAPGAIHVLNAPSPAATSSLMIGRYIANKADTRISSGD